MTAPPESGASRMTLSHSRRTFLHQSAAAVALGLTGSATAAADDKKHYVCVTCGIQFAATAKEPDACLICQDERQYVGHGGQQWTTLDEYKKTHKNVFAKEEDGLHTIHPEPKAGIGQRAFLVRTKEGNLLFDCVPPLDDATIREVKG